MTKQELINKIKGLEARLTLLEARPSYPTWIPYHVTPYWEPYPYHPWPTYPYPSWTTTTGGTSLVTGTTTSDYIDSDYENVTCSSSLSVSA